MALSNAAKLANKASGNTFIVDRANDRVGINSTIPTSTLDVVGIVKATSFVGDGSNLEGVSSAGLGTAIADTLPGSVIYYTDNTLSISDTFTVDAPSNVAYTQYAEIAVEENKDLIIADGDDFIPDILGLSTEGVTPLVGAGGRIRADNFTNKAGNGAPNFPSGLTGTTGTFSDAVSGTTGTFSGAVSGTTGTFSDAVSGTTGTFSDAVSGTTGTFSGNVSVGGTLTYEDVTNVDSIGIVTARTGIKVLAGGINATGISTFSGSTFFTGGLAEKYENAGTTLGAQSANPLSDGNVILFTGNESSGTLTINFTGVHSTLSNGETVSFTAIITPNGTGIITIAQVDGQAITIKWSGGSAPSAGASGQDIYTFQILKTGTGVSDYTIFGAATNYA